MVITWSRLKLPAGRAFLFLLILSLFSCDTPILKLSHSSGENLKEYDPDYEGRETKTFFAMNTVSYQRYSVNAVHLAENEDCVVYGQPSAAISINAAESIASEFKTNIYPVIRGAFGDFRGYLQGLNFGQYDKLILFLLDIQDGYDSVRNLSYVAGYFYPLDMYQSPNSNKAAILYLDVNPGKVNDPEFYTTIAHELQHLINYSIRISQQKGDGSKSVQLQNTWIDEGLASAAEYLYRGEHIQQKIDYFNEDRDGYFSRGETFFSWGSQFEDYCTVYLFFQWLRIQAGTPEIYRDIINSDTLDYRAVTGAGKKYNIEGLDVWEKLLGYWLLANHVNAPQGALGYKGEIDTRIQTFLGVDTFLAPGEGVFSYLDGTGFTSSRNTDSGSNIRYLGVTEKGERIDTPEGLSGLKEKGRLLTFNANTKANAGEERGYLSGKPEPWMQPREGAREAAPLQGPLPIDIPPAFFLE